MQVEHPVLRIDRHRVLERRLLRRLRRRLLRRLRRPLPLHSQDTVSALSRIHYFTIYSYLALPVRPIADLSVLQR